jgi:hypothetical protein
MFYRKNRVLILTAALTLVFVTSPGLAWAEPAQRTDVLQVTHPWDNDIFRPGDVVEIHGTVQGDDFESYVAEWGFGENPTEWFTTGIELMNGGLEPVLDGTLALWDTSSITEATFTKLRVSASFGDSELEELCKVYFDPTLKGGWPVKLFSNADQDAGIGHFEPIAADLNNDGYQEIIVYKAGQQPLLYVYDHNGNVLPNFPIEIEPDSGQDNSVPFPVAADMNNDGYDEVVIYRPKNWNGNCSDRPCVLVYNYNGDLLDQFPVAYPGFSYPNYCRDFCTGRQRLAVADINRNGNLEIVIVGEWAVTVLDNQGNTFDDWPKHIYGWIGGSHEGSPAFGNLDADEDLEIVIADDWADPPNEPGEDRGRIYAYNLDGSDVPGWPVTTRGYSFSSPSIGDIDNDGEEEIAVGFRYLPSEPQEYALYVYDRDGNVEEGWPQLQGKEMWSNPVLADFDGDGELEVVASPEGNASGGSTYVFRSDGSVVEGWPQDMCWTDWYSPVVGDVTGDGVPDVVTNTNYLYGTCSVYAWDFQGELIEGFPKVTGASVDPPVVITDMDNDGYVELIATSNLRMWGDADMVQGCIYVWELDASYDPATMHWPMFQHDLQLTGRYERPLGCAGDLDGDGDTDHADLGIFLADWGCNDPVNGCAGDLDGDDDTDHADLGILLADWGCGVGS